MKTFVTLLALSAACCLFVVPARAQLITPTTVDTGSGVPGADFTSFATVANCPAIAFHSPTEGKLMFTRNNSPDGTGTWTTTVVDAQGAVGSYCSLTIVNGNPAISYYDETLDDLKFARNSAPDGSGTWVIAVVDSPGDVGQYTSLAVVNGRPAISYHDVTNRGVKYARALDANGVNWAGTPISVLTPAPPDLTSIFGRGTSLAVLVTTGNPALAFYNGAGLSFYRATDADGTAWAPSTGLGAASSGSPSLINLFTTHPAVAYRNGSNLVFARNSATDGSGTWTTTNVDSSAGEVSFAVVGSVPNLVPAICYQSGTSLKLARNSATNGAGMWTLSTVEGGVVGNVGRHCSMGIVNGGLAMSYVDSPNGVKFARNSNSSGSGTWTTGFADQGQQAGSVGGFLSHTIVAGHPAFTYVDETNGDLKFARNTQPDGLGSWTKGIVDSAADGGLLCSLAIVDGHPAVLYLANVAGTPTAKYARNSAPDGSGTWTINPLFTTAYLSPLIVVEGKPAFVYQSPTGAELMLARSATDDGSGTWNTSVAATIPGGVAIAPPSIQIVNGRPAAAYQLNEVGLYFAQAGTPNGSGPWSVTPVELGSNVLAFFNSLHVIDGHPAMSYIVRDTAANNRVKFARNSKPDGTGNWIFSLVDSVEQGDLYGSLGVVGGAPAIAYGDAFTRQLKIARNTQIDGSGTWAVTPVHAGGKDGPVSLGTLADGHASIGHHDAIHRDVKWSRVAFPADIIVERPAKTNLPTGTAQTFDGVLNAPVTFTYSLRNFGTLPLTGVAASISPPPQGYSIGTPPPATLAPGQQATFTVQFVPTSTGLKNATLQIASNDPDENPFQLSFSGAVVSFTEDTDLDGLNDGAEVQAGALGFNWQVAQPDLVATYYATASSAGLYTPTQLQALNVNTPILSRPPGSNQFKLTLSLKKSTDLLNYTPLPFTLPAITINPQGQLEFQFTSPDPAAVFRIEAR